MSRNQKPRWPEFYPRMKRRGKGRRRPARVTLYGADWKPVWPPTINGVDIRGGRIIFTSERTGTRAQVSSGSPYWIDMEDNQ